MYKSEVRADWREAVSSQYDTTTVFTAAVGAYVRLAEDQSQSMVLHGVARAQMKTTD